MTNIRSVSDFYNCGLYVGSTVALTDGVCVVKAKVQEIKFQKTQFKDGDDCVVALITMEGVNPLYGTSTVYERTAWPDNNAQHPENNLNVAGLIVIES